MLHIMENLFCQPNYRGAILSFLLLLSIQPTSSSAQIFPYGVEAPEGWEDLFEATIMSATQLEEFSQRPAIPDDLTAEDFKQDLFSAEEGSSIEEFSWKDIHPFQIIPTTQTELLSPAVACHFSGFNHPDGSEYGLFLWTLLGTPDVWIARRVGKKWTEWRLTDLALPIPWRPRIVFSEWETKYSAGEIRIEFNLAYRELHLPPELLKDLRRTPGYGEDLQPDTPFYFFWEDQYDGVRPALPHLVGKSMNLLDTMTDSGEAPADSKIVSTSASCSFAEIYSDWDEDGITDLLERRIKNEIEPGDSPDAGQLTYVPPHSENTEEDLSSSPLAEPLGIVIDLIAHVDRLPAVIVAPRYGFPNRSSVPILVWPWIDQERSYGTASWVRILETKPLVEGDKTTGCEIFVRVFRYQGMNADTYDMRFVFGGAPTEDWFLLQVGIRENTSGE